ncbi:hypothetical protein B0A48_00474 [Cryoendolithus antarcticus]|uniref:Uncharacterized protein n=1 Tax=Cryoendolithus antarcticus TaxID=1507870 RepID=A0A1V8TV83_9PEZI|nr:hypothetical protein B0A48_00474 [Cryoendolithus antarcticus]
MFTVKRDMDDFLINPTVPTIASMENQNEILRATQKQVVSARRSLELLSISKGETSPSARKDGPIEGGDPLEKQLQWRGYDSDEEGVSTPADSDSYSICSASSGEIVEAVAVPARLSLFIPKTPTTETPRTERQLYRAQAVIMRPMGREDSQASPKLVNIPASPRTHRSTPSSSSRGFPFAEEESQRSQSIEDSLHNDSFPSTPRMSSEGRSISSIPSTPATSTDGASQVLDLKLREQTSFAPTEPVRATAPDVTKGQSWREFLTYDDPYPLKTQIKDHMFSPVVPTRRKLPAKSGKPAKAEKPAKPAPIKGQSWREFLSYDDPYPLRSQMHDHLISPLVPTRKGFKKLGSAMGMGRTDRATVNAYKGISASLVEAKYSTQSLVKSKAAKPEVYVPSRPSTSSQRPKLVPRGASERELPLNLPPVPKSYAPSGAPMKLQKENEVSAEVGLAR